MHTPRKQTAMVIGAGPAGLTAAYELATRSSITPIVAETLNRVGGISRTEYYNGYRLDLGGHRFFSKSPRVLRWWLNMVPLEAGKDIENFSDKDFVNIPRSDAEMDEKVMLVRKRLSRILYERKLFDYPIRLDTKLLKLIGFGRSIDTLVSFIKSKLAPVKPERNLEDFMINRFGSKLYGMFFKGYTEKVWGIPCKNIGSDWGRQRIKGLSLGKVVTHSISRALHLKQSRIETSLIDTFLYPKFGPGQLWETVSQEIAHLKGQIYTNKSAAVMYHKNGQISAVDIKGPDGTETSRITCDYLISSMPLSELILSLHPPPPKEIADIAKGLVYRDFITVGLLVDKLKVCDTNGSPLKDNWIYIHDTDVKLGRIQFFKNWSPWLVADHSKQWLGLEYFCSEGDNFWNLPDEEIIMIAADELNRIGFIDKNDMQTGCVIRACKAYPAYWGTYDKIDILQEYLNSFDNLYTIGRNGMHRYNNMDHSMLSAMAAVDHIIEKNFDKKDIWNINAENEYQEERS
ncbi:MAG: NAD(P)-binding protein [Chitinivibrionales bacterium]|nr:NAD(P)-binding protein [Chitinivibrionales bacterium]